MARIISPIIGNISGKLGNLVFKKRGNITYISKLPQFRRIPTDQATIDRKKKFAGVGKIATAINSSPLLKALWIPGSTKLLSPYNKIFKNLFKLFPDLALAPEFGFSLTECSVTFGKSAIFVEAGFSNRKVGLDLAVEKSVLAAGILSLSDPVEENPLKEIFLPVRSDKLPLQSENNSGGFIIPLIGIDKIYYDRYKTKKASICLITLDNSDKPVHYSSTFS